MLASTLVSGQIASERLTTQLDTFKSRSGVEVAAVVGSLKVKENRAKADSRSGRSVPKAPHFECPHLIHERNFRL